MTLSEDNRLNSPWEYPDCPSCGRHIYVDKAPTSSDTDWNCHKCGRFDSMEVRRA